MPDDANAFRVPRGMDFFGGLVRRWERLWVRLGHLESAFLRDALEACRIEMPIYVSGLARSGSTMLLEVLAAHADVATHRYKDFPPFYTPYWWNWFLDHAPAKRVAPVERTHRDGIMVTPDSPEAMEEILWMTFFPHSHDPSRSHVLDGDIHHEEFERFYRDHVRKLLVVRRRGRYAAKGNYNVTRLEYLLTLFPDARFVVPIRDPVAHIGSLVKQQALFLKGQRLNPRMLEHLRRVGHFEFGLDRRPINTGDHGGVQAIVDAWQEGEEILGWARLWSLVYGFLADRLDANRRLRDATLVVRFEDLCASPQRTVASLLDHCRLGDADALIAEFAARMHFPGYYRPAIDARAAETIRLETRGVARRYGYDT